MPTTEPLSAAATEQLLAHTEWLRRVARAITTSTDDADDVVQETWLAAIERPPAHAGNLRGWLATLARNLVRSRRRSRERETVRTRALPPPTPAPTPTESVARAELQQAVLDAVLALAEPYRSTLVQRYCDELSAEEIARRAGVPVETVRTRIKRGLDQVRANVAKRLGGEREQLAALLAPLIAPLLGTGATLVTATSKSGLLAAAVVIVAAAGFAVLRSGDRAQPRGTDPRTEPVAAATAPEHGTVVPETAVRAADTADAIRKDETPVDRIDRGATFDVGGVVLDPAGEPVPDATVLLYDSTGSLDAFSLPRWNGGSDLCAQAIRAGKAQRETTDADGEFSFHGIDAFRKWRVRAIHPEAGMADAQDVVPDGTPPAADVELRLREGMSVRGIVLDAEGKPAPSAAVDVDYATPEFSAVHRVAVAADARFEVPPLPVETLTLIARTDVLTAPTATVVVRASDGPNPHEVTLRCPVAPRTTRLRGRILAEGVALTRARATELGFTAWELARSMGDTLEVAVVPSATAALGGRGPDFPNDGVLDLDAGTYALRRPVRGAVEPASLALVARGRVVALAPLPPGAVGGDGTADVEGPDLDLARDLVDAAPCAAALAIHVRDAANGDDVRGESIYLTVDCADAGRKWSGLDGPDPATHVALFAPASPGRCIVTAEGTGFVRSWVELSIVPRAEPYDITIALERAARTIRGRVVGPDGAPVFDARAWWLERAGDGWRRTAMRAATTDRDGRFALAGVGARAGRVAIESGEFVPAVVDVGAGALDAFADATLRAGAHLRFEITTVAARPELSSNLQIVAADGTVVWQDWGGDFEEWPQRGPRHITLDPGEYRYRCFFIGAAPAEAVFTARDGLEIAITPRLK